ncbi:MAG TPA: M56 family metallopeptidase, partial [Planctomycetaceae bacterium]
RRDHWIGWIELAASSAWWWNPLFWYVCHQLHENAELACDAWVTGLFPQARRAYASALVDLAELDSLQTAIVPALGVGDGSRKLFERRLVMIMGDRVRYRMGTLGFIGIGLLALAALPGCSAGFAADDPATADPQQAQSVRESAPNSGAPNAVAPDPRIESFDPLIAPVSREADPQADNTAPTAEPSASPLGLPVDNVTGRQAPRAEPETPSATPATRGQDLAPVSSDDRLKRLEDRLESLLTELREMKSSGNPRKEPANLRKSKTTVPDIAVPTRSAIDPKTAATPKQVKPVTVDIHTRYIAKVVTLSRTTYKFTPEKADEIANFLNLNLTDEIEVRVKGESLIVTASAEDQTAIAGFLRLLQTRGAEPPKADANDQSEHSDPGPRKASSRAKYLPDHPRARNRPDMGNPAEDGFEQPKFEDRDPAHTPKRPTGF